ncbi:MAG: GNAT family N-acetyltransferase [Tetragenococcus koreensis]|nr:GNAT family protein [Tetragenococcus koreensis]MDN6731740.1 GNAT family N-acetyltransferase [Atopostipes suicloacalis]MCF1632397.1 GNAT family N-acetyltransferase [Tetragenococcus koreensis]MDN6165202.1 GNAT family N-acetyltransferase [Tetragenococcus koreensis]MDN6383056.1 GNAT family N-acetyltransferase [Tetragenococcus koreensis]MDN6471240.1 GNAT family N-acetyltransferase [Tetragenococcus koreensis]
MTEATNCVVAFLFKQVGYRRIIGWCDVANTASSLVLSNVGMQLEGTLRQQIVRKDGTYGDEYMYGILKDEMT